MRILFITPFIPYPPDGDGTRLILWNIAQELSKRHELVLLALFDGEEAPEALHSVKRWFAEIVLVQHSQGVAKEIAALFRSFISQLPAGVEKFRSRGLLESIGRIAGSNTFDVVHIDMYAMGQYLVQAPARCIMSVHDSRSLTLEEQLRYAGGIGFVKRLLLNRELRLMRRYESLQYGAYAKVVVVSKQEEEHLKSLNPSIQTVVVHNGVSVSRPSWSPPEEPHAIVFSGDMSYFPNEDAANDFARSVFPDVRSRIQDARFYIVGRKPSQSLRLLAREVNGVVVTGEVPELRTYIRRCAVAVAPVRFGGGVKNKILEALAEGRPVVALDSACGGLREGFEEVVKCVASRKEMVDRIVELLDSPESIKTLGMKATRFVEEHHSWRCTAEAYERIYRGGAP